MFKKLFNLFAGKKRKDQEERITGEISLDKKSSVKYVERSRYRGPDGISRTYEVYRTYSPQEAFDFILKKKVDEEFHYIEVETPKGRCGKDIIGIYSEFEHSNFPKICGVCGSENQLKRVTDKKLNEGYFCGKCFPEWSQWLSGDSPFLFFMCSNCGLHIFGGSPIDKSGECKNCEANLNIFNSFVNLIGNIPKQPNG